jgi:Fe-S oxidoreductase
MGEPFKGEWNGDKLLRPMRMKRDGHGGIFDPPREILKAIPGVKLVEMERIREYSWCCGAGGGVLEAYPDFAAWTAEERLEEARSTGAGAMVTACPWCLRLFKDTLAQSASNGFKVYDLTELVCEAGGLEREGGW